MKLTLNVLPQDFAIVQLPSNEDVPDWLTGDFYSITQTSEELSIVCEQSIVPGNIKKDTNWKALKIQGQLDFSLVGILENLSSTLAQGGVSIFTISTYNTDYVFVKNKDLEKAITLLKAAGHTVE